MAYDDIKLKDNDYENEQLDEEIGHNQSRLHTKRKFRRPVSNIDQFAFCQLHTLELVVKPNGSENGWPTHIDFDKLKKRIYRLRKELDMVISKHLHSTYRDMALKAYEELGKNKARSTMGMMSRFETVLPGYYGTKGASVIQDHLATLYLHKGKLLHSVTAPQTPIEYLQQVLIPEVGFRLIREDLINKDPTKRYHPKIDQEAKMIMSKSASFGSCVHPLDWNDPLSADEEENEDDGQLGKEKDDTDDDATTDDSGDDEHSSNVIIDDTTDDSDDDNTQPQRSSPTDHPPINTSQSQHTVILLDDD
ncbi:RTC4-like domain-containing protein [Chlamydoabsidia padenii]|nr:RTC4-like domain-containing protein [Chlamydoabsidia padenii]